MQNIANIDKMTHELIGLAWADEISFDAIKRETGKCEAEIIVLMRTHLKPKSFQVWRERVSGRKSKHEKLQYRA